MSECLASGRDFLVKPASPPCARLDPHRFGPDAVVAFPARRLNQAQVIWLNERWFLDEGVDIFVRDSWNAVAASVVDQFGVVSETSASPGIADGALRWLDADRYGGTNGAAHGGSGRAGAKHGFNAKGIGRTPLVSNEVDALHSSGLPSVNRQ